MHEFNPDDRYPFPHGVLGIPYLGWSDSLLKEYRTEFSCAVEYLRNLNKDDFAESVAYTESRHFLPHINAIAICSLMKKLGMEMNSAEEVWHRCPLNFSSRMDFELLVACLVREYVSFLSCCLRSKSQVGKTTNFARLRHAHVFNKSLPAQFDTPFDIFFDPTNCQIIENHSIRKPKELPNIDFLDVMRRTLGGQEHRTTHIPLSILNQMDGVIEFGKSTWLRKITRRNVRLLRSGQDIALVIPYLSKIILQLNDDRWVRDHDVEALQPCRGEYNEGTVRRAETVLLGFDYPETGQPTINESAYRLLNQYARKGEVSSEELWEAVLSVKKISHRVNIQALLTCAREVFGNDENMTNALTREMAHDILVTKSDFEDKQSENTMYSSSFNREAQAHRNDAYYGTFYKQVGIDGRNNVLWISGVPLLGLLKIPEMAYHLVLKLEN